MPGKNGTAIPHWREEKPDKTIRHGAEGRNARISALSACGFFATLLSLASLRGSHVHLKSVLPPLPPHCAVMYNTDTFLNLNLPLA
jgi:hypothetical protein